MNLVKRIIDVLKYVHHHKYAVRRSALSYYQNTYPSKKRIDFGKIQYGVLLQMKKLKILKQY